MQTLIDWLKEPITHAGYLEQVRAAAIQLPESPTKLQLYAALERLDKTADGRTGLTVDQAFIWSEMRWWVAGWLRARPDDFEAYHRALRQENPLWR